MRFWSTNSVPTVPKMSTGMASTEPTNDTLVLSSLAERYVKTNGEKSPYMISSVLVTRTT